MRRLARLRRLLGLRPLRLVLTVTLLRPLARGARLVPAFLPVVLLLAVAAAIAAAVARRPGALPAALVTLRLVSLRRGMGLGSGLEARNHPLLDLPADQALDRGQ